MKSNIGDIWDTLYSLLQTSIISKCEYHKYQDYFSIESFRYIMPLKYSSKRKRPHSSKSSDQPNWLILSLIILLIVLKNVVLIMWGMYFKCCLHLFYVTMVIHIFLQSAVVHWDFNPITNSQFDDLLVCFSKR